MCMKWISDAAKSTAAAMPTNDAKRLNFLSDLLAFLAFGFAYYFGGQKDFYPNIDEEFKFTLSLILLVFAIIMTVYCLLTHAKVPTGSNS